MAFVGRGLALLNITSVCLTIGLRAPLVVAQETNAEAKAAARELAIEGITAAQAGKCADALPQLERAEALYHAPTILTWIGDCQIQLGRLVAGTETLNQVVRERLAPDADPAFHEAQARAATLLSQTKPKIARLTIEVEPNAIEGLEVLVDERPIQAGLVGFQRPIDPGARQVVVRAPGYFEETQQIELAEGGTGTLSFQLVADPKATPLHPAPATNTPPPAEPNTRSGGAQRTFGWIGVGLGAAALAGGGVTGLLALNTKGELNCPGNVCADNDANKLDQANDLALASTVLFSAGGALAVTGIVLLLTAPSNVDSAVLAEPSLTWGSVRMTPGLTPGGATLRGTF